MRDFKFLKLLDFLKPIFEKLGIEYSILRKILQIKLTMDERRVPTILSNMKGGSAEGDHKFLKSLGIYLLMGLILIPFVWMKYDYMFQMCVLYSIIIFFIMTTLISDFSAVLLDLKDKNIIGTKPVSAKTLHMAKTLHLSYYMFSISAALTGPALLISLYRQGILFFLIFLVSIILLDMLIIVLTAFIYLFVLRFFDGEKLKDIINYIQIILTIVISVGYQVLIRLFDFMDLEVRFAVKWWQFFIIPIWYSAPFQMLKSSEVSSSYVIFTIMALLVPIIATAVYIRLMPFFEQYLQKLNTNSIDKKKVKRKPTTIMSKIFCRNNEERVFFRFTINMMKNEREFKLKVYPSLGFAFVFPYIFLFQQASGYQMTGFSHSKLYYTMYFCGLMIPTIMWMMRYSSNYKGAWIFKTTPLSSYLPVFRGTMKAGLVRLFLPLFLFETITFLPIFGVRILPELIGILINILIFNLLCFIYNEKSLPFSKEFSTTQQMDGIITFALFIVLGIMGGVHYFISRAPFGGLLYIIVGALVYMILWKVILPKQIQNLENV